MLHLLTYICAHLCVCNLRSLDLSVSRPLRSAVRSFFCTSAYVRGSFSLSTGCYASDTCSVLLCRYDRPEEVDDIEAVAEGYCNLQFETVEGVWVLDGGGFLR